jgi:type I restriction enzyme M protein
MNWGNAAIGKINSVLHGLEATIAAGASTITDPAFKDEDGKVRKFSLVLANFPFSDEFWWLKPEQQTDDKKKKDKLKKEIFARKGYKDPFGRFGRARLQGAARRLRRLCLHPAHPRLAHRRGRAGIVCPQGVLFRGQPEVEEETGEFDDDGNPIIKRRKADDEHLIRKALLESRLIDAVISLPLNVFYGAGVPACLLILKQAAPAAERHDKVLLVYAARHYRELSNQNELRPQDVMRMLVHVPGLRRRHKVPALVAQHSQRIREQINAREHVDEWSGWRRNTRTRRPSRQTTDRRSQKGAPNCQRSN